MPTPTDETSELETDTLVIDLTGVVSPDDDHVLTLPDGSLLVVDDDE